jgi:hypothetical protein
MPRRSGRLCRRQEREYSTFGAKCKVKADLWRIEFIIHIALLVFFVVFCQKSSYTYKLLEDDFMM